MHVTGVQGVQPQGFTEQCHALLPVPGIGDQGAGCCQEGWVEGAGPRRAWVPPMHLYPDAGVPVFQVSMPAKLDAKQAWAFGQALAPLAEDGVLIVGSGSLTHNLYKFREGQTQEAAYAVAFARWVREAVEQGDRARLMRTLDAAPNAQRAHPTAEHFWPLLVAAGAADLTQPVQVIEGGVVHGVLSMDAYAFGVARTTTH